MSTHIKLKQSAIVKVLDYSKVTKKVTLLVIRDGSTTEYKLGTEDTLNLNFDFEWNSTGEAEVAKS